MSLNINVAGLDENSKIYIKPSLCAYFKLLAFNCRLLKTAGRIAGVLTSDDGTIKIKTLDNRFVKIIHETDLTSGLMTIIYFPFYKIFLIYIKCVYLCLLTSNLLPTYNYTDHHHVLLKFVHV